VIVGGGPAGLSAAVYAARAGMAPLVVARDGGQLEGTSWVHNYPGFDEGVEAIDLIQRLERQAKLFGADYKSCWVEKVDLTCRPFKLYCEDGEIITSSSLVVATGASPKWLGVPGERKLLSKGVHTCATCDGYFYKNRHAVVVGGGEKDSGSTPWSRPFSLHDSPQESLLFIGVAVFALPRLWPRVF